MADRLGIFACVGCGNHVNPDDPGVLSEVTGWTAPRQAGGANHIVGRESTGRYCHKACLWEHADREQHALF